MMLVVGLTGGIGSGKTTVAQLFAKHDVPVIDADEVAKEITLSDQSAFASIVKHFGQEVVQSDASLNRKLLREIIFSNPNERLWLEKLLHPKILHAMEQTIAKWNSQNIPYCIAVIPLLLEVEFFSFINRILVVDAPVSEQIKRVRERDHLSEQEIDGILQSQAHREDRRAKAHDIIVNDGKLEDLIPQVEKLHEKYMKISCGNVKAHGSSS